ncbi:hypothetical protein BGP_0870 [Beggiatoa sp. PS]|nr:hypothetical protein BGP_0870 [Beggiatoa sp. PS]
MPTILIILFQIKAWLKNNEGLTHNAWCYKAQRKTSSVTFELNHAQKISRGEGNQKSLPVPYTSF